MTALTRSRLVLLFVVTGSLLGGALTAQAMRRVGGEASSPRWQAADRAPSGDGTVLDVSQFAGSDLGQKLIAADGALGSRSGSLVIKEAGTVTTPFTLHAGHKIVFRAAVLFPTQVTLRSHTSVSCEGPETRLTASFQRTDVFKNGMFVGDGASDVSISGCRFALASPGLPKPAILTGEPISQVHMSHNDATDVRIFACTGGPNSSTDLTFEGNVERVTDKTGDYAGILLFYAKGVIATGNSFTGSEHGIQYWGGDSNGGWSLPGRTFAEGSAANVNAAGDMTITGTHCSRVRGACVWGSMGYHITMRGGMADGCGDTCWDPEGSVDVLVADNVAQHYGNFCMSVFFQSKANHFENNRCSGRSLAVGILFGIKHSSGSDGPNHEDLRIEGNELDCGGVLCAAVYSEGFASLVIKANRITNGTIGGVNYNRNFEASGNQMVFTVPTTKVTAIAVPAIVGGSTATIAGNVVEAKTASPGSTCLSATWSDYNAADFFHFVRNTCAGWAVDVATTNAGTNVGKEAVPRAVWTFEGNHFLGGVMTHVLGPGTGANDSYLIYAGNTRDIPASGSTKAQRGVPIQANARRE